MPLVRLLGQRFGTPVDHADGQRGCLCLRGPARLMPPRPRLWEGSRAEEWLETRQLDGADKQEVVSNPIVDRRAVMGAYCTLDYTRRHPAKMGEILEVRRFHPYYHYVAVFGDNKEIACIPHRGCSLEIVAVPGTSHGAVNLLLPGQVLRYTRSFFFGDRLELPSGKKVGFDQLVGFKLQLAPRMAAAPPDEETISKSVPAGRPDGVIVAG
jgi:hypothetical protein